MSRWSIIFAKGIVTDKCNSIQLLQNIIHQLFRTENNEIVKKTNITTEFVLDNSNIMPIEIDKNARWVS